jgi:anti-sigma factor RsiW
VKCAQARQNLHPYVDGELAPADMLALEAHLVECLACRAECEELLAGVETVRGASGLYEAPRTSKESASRLVTRHYQRRRWWGIAAAVAVVMSTYGVFEFIHHRLNPPDRFAMFAAESHLRFARGAMPLDFRSDQPAEVSRWLSDRLSFKLTLPNYPEASGQSKKYVLAGARLMQSDEDDIAYLAYRMDDRPISLLIASSSRIVPTGGDLYQSGGLTFHSTSSKGLQMITWVDRGLSYALVSDLRSVGAESCVVCHSKAGEDRKFAPLRPRI